jgi:hypothetical protein
LFSWHPGDPERGSRVDRRAQRGPLEAGRRSPTLVEQPVGNLSGPGRVGWLLRVGAKLGLPRKSHAKKDPAQADVFKRELGT